MEGVRERHWARKRVGERECKIVSESKIHTYKQRIYRDCLKERGRQTNREIESQTNTKRERETYQ